MKLKTWGIGCLIGLGLSVFVPASFAGMAEVTASFDRLNPQHVFTLDLDFPQVFYNNPANAARVRLIEELVVRLRVFINQMGHYGRLVVPGQSTLEITEGNDPRNAAALPMEQIIRLDEASFGLPWPLAEGLAGHEAGHLLFYASGLAYLNYELGNRTAVKLSEIVQHARTDKAVIQASSRLLLNQYPGLTDPKSWAHLPLEVVGKYRLFQELEAALPERLKVPPDWTAIDYVLMDAMIGMQEVFSDLSGLMFSGDPQFALSFVTDPAERNIRNFTTNYLPLMVDHNFELTEAGKHVLATTNLDIPHLMLFDLRWKIYNRFYAGLRKYPRQNVEYDARVLRYFMESCFKVMVRVYRTDPPKLKEATLALVYKEALPQVLAEMEAAAIVEMLEAAEECASRTAEQAPVKKKKVVTEQLEVRQQQQYRQHGAGQ